jgi:uncharacterized protein involved in exopolysaccharide biosynthesis
LSENLQPQSAQPQPARILVAEDESNLRLVLQKELQRMGHEVRVAPDGEAALRLLEESNVDVLLTDINMPRVDGVEVLRRLKAEEQRLRDTIATYQRRVDEMPQREAEFQQMARDHETTRDLYTSLLARYEEATMGETMEHRNKGEVFRVVDPAVPAESPAAPKRLLLVLVCGMVALALAGAVVIVAEQLDTSFHSVESLRGFTSVPLAVAVPRILTENDHIQYRRRASFAATGALAALVLIMGAGYYYASGNYDLVALLIRRTA